MTRRYSRLATAIRRLRPMLERLERRDLPSFLAPLLIPTGDQPISIAAADFNGDGHPDLATGNGKGSMSVILAVGDGTFEPSVNYFNGGDLRSLAVSEFNGDGKLDIATVHYKTASVSINFGNGDGTFQAAVSIPAGFHASGLAVADFDGDGDNDIAVPNSALNGGLALLLNHGDGTFDFTGFAVPAHPSTVVAADFNTDGVLDLAVRGSSLHVLIGNGDASFQPPVLVGSGFGIAFVVTDLHGDGNADIVLTNNNSDTISVLRGNGDGTFLPPKTYPAGTKPNSIAAQNVDGDADVDIVVGNTASTITVLRNQFGSLRRRVSYSVGDSPAAVAIGDVNIDGLADVATANAASDSATILLGTGGGAFSALPVHSLPTGGKATGIVAEDVDVDGILDLTVPYSVDIIPNSLWTSYLTTFNGVGNGTFSAGTSILSEGGGDVIVQDLNHDGFQDFAVGRYYATIHLGGPSGYFQAPEYDAGPTLDDVVVGDFDQDGILDMVLPNKIGPGTVTVLFGNSDGSFGPPNSFAAGSNPSAVAVSDLNGDGFLDLAVASSNANILLGNGDGSFQPVVAYNSGGAAVGIVTDDYNGDGMLDIAVATTNGIRVLLNLGGGTFGTPINFALYEPLALAGGDFNSDGRADLVVSGGKYPNNGLFVLLGNGNGTFDPPMLVADGAPRPDVDVADINNDGFQDIVAHVYPLVRVVLGNGDGAFLAAPSVFSEPNSLAIDDIDEDGDLDLVTVLESITAVRRGNGDGTFSAPSRYVIGSAITSVAVADFNGDGFRDIVGVGNIGAHVLLNMQDGIFPAPAVYEGGLVDAGDFNADGLLDLASTNAQGYPPSVEVLLATGAGGVYPTVQTYEVGKLPIHAIVAEFNNDGILDIASANYDGAAISVLIGLGDGTFESSMAFPAGTKPESLATGDFNGDGNVDVTVTNEVNPGTVRLLLGNGDGTFQAPIVISTGTGTIANIATSDFNGDGKVDVAVVAPSAISVLLGNGDGSFKPPLVYAVLANGLDLTVGDFNGDGFIDIAAVNAGSLAILFNAGDWPPLPIGDGPSAAGGFAPLHAGDSTVEFHPTMPEERAEIGPPLKPAHKTETVIALRPKYAARRIARVALAVATDSAFDLLSTDLK